MSEKIIGDMEPKEGPPIKEKPIEDVSKTGPWAWVKRNWGKLSGAVSAVAFGVVLTMSQSEKTITVCAKHPNLPEAVCVTISDTSSKEDSARLVYVIDSLNGRAREIYCTDKNDYSKVQYSLSSGVLMATTGAMEAVKEYRAELGKDIDIEKPVLYEIQTEKSTDSTYIIWVSTTEYLVCPDTITSTALEKGYSGTFDRNMGRAFHVGDILELDGNRRPSLAVIDYEAGTYFVPGPIRVGEAIDPGYASAPVLFGAAMSLYRDTLANTYWDTTGLAHMWSLNSDTGAGGVTADSGNTSSTNNGTFKNGAKIVASNFITGNGSASIDSNGQYIDCGDVSQFDGATALTISGWARHTGTFAYDCIFQKGNAANATFKFDVASNSRFWIGADLATDVYMYSDANPVAIGAWYHWAFRYSGGATGDTGKAQLYINGLRLSMAYVGTMPTSIPNYGDSSFTLGKVPYLANSTGLKGNMDGVRFRTNAMDPIGIRTMAVRDSGHGRGRMVNDTIKSYVAGVANAKFFIAGKQVDTLFVYRPSPATDTLKFGTGTNDTILNIYSILQKDTVHEDSTIIKTVLPSGDTLVQYMDSVRVESKGDAPDLINLSGANNVGRNLNTQYKVYLRAMSHREYARDTIHVSGSISVDSIFPTGGITHGFLPDTIWGSGFGDSRGNGAVYFGDSVANGYPFWSDTKIVALTAAHPRGVVSVAVQTNAGTAETLSNAFTFRRITPGK